MTRHQPFCATNSRSAYWIKQPRPPFCKPDNGPIAASWEAGRFGYSKSRGTIGSSCMCIRAIPSNERWSSLLAHFSKLCSEKVTFVPGGAGIGLSNQIANQELQLHMFGGRSEVEGLVHIILRGVVDGGPPVQI